ncbi:MAG: cyclic nucleotide-binding domain-containing protein, partial [bacterium]|nr:cyclic nucleotide-binding domain-containing protein [bacterium]
LDRKIFLLIKGRVNISKDVLAGDCKKEKHISTVEGSGHFLGEISAITGKPRTASVTALAKTVCVVIDIALLMEASSTLLERVKSKLYPKLFELLGKRLEETNECMVALKQQVEDLENKIMKVMQEKYQVKQAHREELRERNMEIKSLLDKLAKFNLM